MMYRDVLPAAILISVPGCLLDWRMFRISPEVSQRSATIGKPVASSILAWGNILVPAPVKYGLEQG